VDKMVADGVPYVMYRR